MSRWPVHSTRLHEKIARIPLFEAVLPSRLSAHAPTANPHCGILFYVEANLLRFFIRFIDWLISSCITTQKPHYESPLLVRFESDLNLARRDPFMKTNVLYALPLVESNLDIAPIRMPRETREGRVQGGPALPLYRYQGRQTSK